jgi:hypothetical protein
MITMLPCSDSPSRAHGRKGEARLGDLADNTLAIPSDSYLTCGVQPRRSATIQDVAQELSVRRRTVRVGQAIPTRPACQPEEWKSASGESLIRGAFQSVGECPRPTTGSIRLGSRRSKWEPECTLCCVGWPIATMGCARTRAPAQALRPSTPLTERQDKAYLANKLSTPNYRPSVMFVTMLSEQSGYLSPSST